MQCRVTRCVHVSVSRVAETESSQAGNLLQQVLTILDDAKLVHHTAWVSLPRIAETELPGAGNLLQQVLTRLDEAMLGHPSSQPCY